MVETITEEEGMVEGRLLGVSCVGYMGIAYWNVEKGSIKCFMVIKMLLHFRILKRFLKLTILISVLHLYHTIIHPSIQTVEQHIMSQMMVKT